MTPPQTLIFRPGRDGLVARADDGRVVLPARGEAVREGVAYVATSLRPTISGRAYIASGLVAGRWESGYWKLGLQPHIHTEDCPICAAETARRMAAPCPRCGQPLGRNWEAERCLDCQRADVQAAVEAARRRAEALVEAAWPQIEAWRAEILSRPLPTVPTPGHLLDVREISWEGPSSDGYRPSARHSVFRSRYSCGHELWLEQRCDSCPECAAQAERALEATRALRRLQHTLQTLSDAELRARLIEYRPSRIETALEDFERGLIVTPLEEPETE